MTPQELEDRLVDFSVAIIDVVEALPGTKAGNHVAGQLIRSGTSAAPNYGEARSAESRRNFIHKMKISLKELRESLIWLKVIARKRLTVEKVVSDAIKECDRHDRHFRQEHQNRGRPGFSLTQPKIHNRQPSIVNPLLLTAPG